MIELPAAEAGFVACRGSGRYLGIVPDPAIDWIVCSAAPARAALHEYWEFKVKYLVRVLRSHSFGGFSVVSAGLLGLALVLMPGAGPASLAEGVVDYPDTATKADAEKKKDSKSEDKKKDGEDEEEEEETLEEAVKDLEKIEGLFTFYRDKEDGALMMEVTEAQLADGVEFIYHGITLNGAADVGFNHILGSYRQSSIISFSRYFDRIEIHKLNTGFYFDPENALSRVSDANIQPALLAVAPVVAKSEDGTRYLIDADPVFQDEVLSQITPSSFPGIDDSTGFSLGGLNGEKTRLVDVRSYPENSLLTVDYTFDNSTPVNYGGPDVTDGRTVTITFQHSLIAMPQTGYEPRLDDHRVGYFFQRVTDLTDVSVTPWRDLINRWRLVKKDPDADISEPVTPITYWIENSTPVAYRDAIRNGVLAWNSSFEKAGFRNAIEVKIQPDDAEWDAGDIRYNVIRWVSSPQPYYGGYGPSLPNPRTGEIIAADIVLEQVYTTNRILYTDLFDEAALPSSERQASQIPFGNGPGPELCAMGQSIQNNTLFGVAALTTQGASDEEIGDLVEEGLYELALHEVGHTLGLMHNMKATQAVPYEDIHSAERKARGWLTGSVMDYTTININPDRSKQGLYYSVTPGPYDDWAIEFGYRSSLENSEAESGRVKSLLARSTEAELAFGNDADDMRSPEGGIDPRVMVDDLTDNAIQYGIDRMEFVDARLVDLKTKFEKEGDTWDSLRTAYFILTGQKSSQARVIANYIGGVYLERAEIGQPGSKAPYTPVAEKDQRRAMAALGEYVFAPDAWSVPEELIQHLQRKRRGFEHWGQEDPRMHGRVLRMQAQILETLLHANTTQRMLDSSLYGNDYPPAEVLQDLTDAVFRADLRTSVNTYRQNLQIYYTNLLVHIASGDSGRAYPIQSAVLHQLKRIDRMERQAKSRDVATAAHRGHVRHVIETALYGKASRL